MLVGKVSLLLVATILALGVIALHLGAEGSAQRARPRGLASTRAAQADQFVEVSARAGINFTLTSGGPEKRYIIQAKGGGGIAWIDYNNDGYVDLFLVDGSTFERWRRGDSPRSRLYRNNGDGNFTDVSAGSGLDRTGWGMGTCVGDYTNDGYGDLYVTYYGGNVLYRNNGNGAFTDVGVEAGVAYSGEGQEQAGMGTDFGDYGNDGWLDLVKGNFSDDTNNLYRNNRDGTFTDVAYAAGLGDIGWLFTTFGAMFLDYDNDGWRDIFLANGQTFPQMDHYPAGITYSERNLLFHNQHDGKFEEVGLRSGPGLAIQKVSRGLAATDYDNDGDLEVMVSNMNDSPDLLRLARKNGNHSILVKTVGTRSNRNGIGTKITVEAGGLKQYDEVKSGGSYLSSSDLRVHFGLGNISKVDRLELRWPSGETDVVENPPVDRILVIKEGQGLAESRPFRKASAQPGRSMKSEG